MKKRSREKPAIQPEQMLLLQEKLWINMARYATFERDPCWCWSLLWLIVQDFSNCSETCFHFAFLYEKARFQRKRWCAAAACLECVIYLALALTRWDYRVHALSLHDPYGRIVPKGKPYLGKFGLCTCMHHTFLLRCYVLHWNVFPCGNFPIPWERKHKFT